MAQSSSSSSSLNPAATSGFRHEKLTANVPLTTQDFHRALERYIEEMKPDPIARRQLQDWTLQWVQDTGAGDDNNLDNDTTNSNKKKINESSQLLPDATHSLKGRLHINGPYMCVVLEFECAWRSLPSSSTTTDKSTHSDDDNNHNNNSKYGTLCYRCLVHSARMLPPPSSSSTATNASDDDKRNLKSQQRIHQKMNERLRQDSYISKYLLSMTTTENQNENDDGGGNAVLAHARIHNMKDNNKGQSSSIDEIDLDAMVAQMNAAAAAAATSAEDSATDSHGNCSSSSAVRLSPLEERVDVCEPVAEAVRRAVWSSSESSLDIVELILTMPTLPTTDSMLRSMGDDTLSSSSLTTPLANRAKLRLLEDAMLDACEREGEDGLLEELSIKEAVDNHHHHHHREQPHQYQQKQIGDAMGDKSNDRNGNRSKQSNQDGPKRKRGKKNK